MYETRYIVLTVTINQNGFHWLNMQQACSKKMNLNTVNPDTSVNARPSTNKSVTTENVAHNKNAILKPKKVDS